MEWVAGFVAYHGVFASIMYACLSALILVWLERNV